jgi:transcriptional regulator with XRE-family HTH domain
METRQSAQQDPGYEPIPGFLRHLRQEADLSQRALGQLLGKPQSWIQNCEIGSRRVDVREFIAWASACGVSPKVAMNRLLQLMGDQHIG